MQIELLTRTVRDTVTTVLKSCDLSLDYVNEVPSAKKGPDRPIRWDPTFYTFYGIPNPFAPRRQPKMEDSLRYAASIVSSSRTCFRVSNKSSMAINQLYVREWSLITGKGGGVGVK